MKRFQQHQIKLRQVEAELDLLEQRLKKPVVGERELLRLFSDCHDLTLFMGATGPFTGFPDLYANELDLFGDFTCDLVLGSKAEKAFHFIELEDARPESLFKQTNRTTPDWSPRLEHGCSQLIDWLWKLDEQRGQPSFEQLFHSRSIAVSCMVITGRDAGWGGAREKARLAWRQNSVFINGCKVSILTYDELASKLRYRLDSLRQL